VCALLQVRNSDVSEMAEDESVSTSEALVAPKKHIDATAFVGTFGTSVFIQACTVVQGILVARLLGPLGRGEYAAIVLWPSVFAAVTIFGSNIALARAAAKEHDRGAITRTAFVLGLVTSLLGIILCYPAIPWLLPPAESHLIGIARIFVAFIPLNHLALNLIAIDQGVGDFRRFNLTRAILNPLYLGIVIVLWLSEITTVKWLVIALLAANGGVVALRSILACQCNPILGKLFSPFKILKQSVRFGLAGIADPLYQQADKALLLWLLGPENLGTYVVALSASAVVGSITTASGMVTFTMAARSACGRGFEEIAKAFRMSLSLWILLGGLLAIVMPWLLPLVYGSDFAAAITPSRLLIIGSACAGLSTQLEQAMRGQGRAFVGLEGRLAGLILMALLGVALSHAYALNGLCIAFLLGQLSCLLVIVRCANAHYKVRSPIGCWVPGRSDVAEMLPRIRQQVNTLRSSIFP
jgi:enterobacterial common antigen flippase